MKIINNKNIFILLISFVLLAFGILGYKAFNAYTNYKSTQKSTQNLIFVKTLDTLVDRVIEERLVSATYLGTKGKTGFEKIKKARVLTDGDLMQLDNYIDEHQVFANYKKQVEDIKENLKYVRTKVDTLSTDYTNIFLKTYHTKIVLLLIDGMKNILEEKSSIKIFKDFTSLKENIQLENTTISHTLITSKKMSNSDLEIWNTLLIKSTIPQIDILQNKTLISKISALMSPEEFSKLGKSVRISILYDALQGKYSVKRNEWASYIKKKITYVDSAQGILIENIENKINHNVSHTKDMMLKYFLAAGVACILLLVLLVIFYNINKDKQLFEDTLKDIETVLSHEQQEELKMLIDKRDINQIYKFLTNTIKEANEAKDLFLANMSHEIRTPLNGIVGFTQLLKGTETSVDQNEFITIIENSSDNLLTIVNDILDFSKIKANQIKLEHTAFSPLESFESTIELYGARASEKDISLNTFVDPNLPIELMGDPTKISQILVNLLSNALKFTDLYGNVNVSILKEKETDSDATLKFVVEDSGIGITDDQKDKIFDEFSQADVSTSRKFGGTGLGLSISSKFVKLMGGKLEIESEEDKGSKFFFTLTLDKSDMSSAKTKPNRENIHVGYLVPNRNIDVTMQENMMGYIAYLGARLTIYEDKELFEMEPSKLPDILFINHKYCKYNDEIKSYLALDVKTVVMTTGRLKSELVDLEDNISKVLYQPMNFTKVLKSFEVLDTQDINLTSNIQDIDTTFKKFNNIHVLVAEDNDINQKLIQNVLEGFNIDVTLVSDGKQALELRKKNIYDMIFMDIQMPVMGGIDATKSILEFEKREQQVHVPIVALTANALAGDKEKYINAGMDDYLSKPIELNNISLLLEKYFSTQMMIVENETRIIENIVEENIIDNKNQKKNNNYDVLFYHPFPLITNLYQSKFENLNYTIDIVTDEHLFLDRLESNAYQFVIYSIDTLKNMECLICDLVKDNGAKPFIFVSKGSEIDLTCQVDIIDTGMDIKKLKEKLNETNK